MKSALAMIRRWRGNSAWRFRRSARTSVPTFSNDSSFRPRDALERPGRAFGMRRLADLRPVERGDTLNISYRDVQSVNRPDDEAKVGRPA